MLLVNSRLKGGEAQHVALARRVGATKRQRTIRHPAIEQTALFEILNEKRQLAKRRDGFCGIPFDVHPAAERVSDR
ncbi:MAG: hypothetical protein JO212_15180 [Acetobacteraceae bacterium]|nr:hypothetical protein [Acetobacteraceae bacterium]